MGTRHWPEDADIAVEKLEQRIAELEKQKKRLIKTHERNLREWKKDKDRIAELESAVNNDENWRSAYYDRAVQAEAKCTELEAKLDRMRTVLRYKVSIPTAVRDELLAEFDTALGDEDG